MNKKILDFIEQDILYKNMFNFYKKQENFNEILKFSGLIEEPLTEIDKKVIEDNTILTMPINSPKTNKKLAVIISTGSYSPLHEGHIEKMLLSKNYVEDKGYEVLQGIISLSHDQYVAFKNNGISKNHISNRTMLAYKKIEEMKQSDWLKVDRFEGEFVSCAINFSTVIKRTMSLIENYINKEITIFYVFGSDNIGFSYAFVSQNKIHGICIERKGYERLDIFKKINIENVHYIDSKKSKYSDMSSTMIRNKTNIKYDIKKVKKNKKPLYLIRGNSVCKEFNDQLVLIFKKYLNKDIEIRLYETDKEHLNNFISLDKFITGDINIETSRNFEISSFQKNAIDMVIFNIDGLNNHKKTYSLIDDDSVSGYTIKKIKEYLNKLSINIDKVETIVNRYIDEEKEYLYDVVDSRDFLINGFKSGLMIEHPTYGVMRVPYLFPYVNLTTRANIPSEKQISFSKDILDLNKTFNNKLSNKVIDFDYLLNIYNNFLSTEVV